MTTYGLEIKKKHEMSIKYDLFLNIQFVRYRPSKIEIKKERKNCPLSSLEFCFLFIFLLFVR